MSKCWIYTIIHFFGYEKFTMKGKLKACFRVYRTLTNVLIDHLPMGKPDNRTQIMVI